LSTSTENDTKFAHSLHHTNFPTTDIDRTKDWYARVFGMRQINIGRFTAGEPTTLLMTNGNFDLHFEYFESFDMPLGPSGTHEGGNLFHVAVEIEDWEPFAAHLEKLGVPLEGYKERPQNNSKSANLRDPDGHLIEVTWHGDRDW
jgi:catechol 2,3-dioxygenase-like lactoylglutathione lyase family enzyme